MCTKRVMIGVHHQTCVKILLLIGHEIQWVEPVLGDLGVLHSE